MSVLNDEVPDPEDPFESGDGSFSNLTPEDFTHESGSNPPGWLLPNELDQMRKKTPIPYVQLVPAHIDSFGRIRQVATLLRVSDDGTVERSLVSGRVLYLESIREAIARNIAKDLGDMALPRMPLSLQPFMVAEFFPTRAAGQMYDRRQHALALCYIIPVDGDCRPQDNALDLKWLSPNEVEHSVLDEMVDGQGRILVQALRWAGSILR